MPSPPQRNWSGRSAEQIGPQRRAGRAAAQSRPGRSAEQAGPQRRA
eukprot:gene25654-biopygen21009